MVDHFISPRQIQEKGHEKQHRFGETRAGGAPLRVPEEPFYFLILGHEITFISPCNRRKIIRVLWTVQEKGSRGWLNARH